MGKSPHVTDLLTTLQKERINQQFESLDRECDKISVPYSLQRY